MSKWYRCIACGVETTDKVCQCGQRCIPVSFEEPRAPLELRRNVQYKNRPLYVPQEYWDVPTPLRLPAPLKN